MLEAFLYQEEDHPTPNEILGFAIRAAVSDTSDSSYAPLVGSLLDAYHNALDLDPETQEELQEAGEFLSLDEAHALYRKSYLGVCNLEEDCYVPESIPQEKHLQYPATFIRTVATVDAQRAVQLYEWVAQVYAKRQST